MDALKNRTLFRRSKCIFYTGTTVHFTQFWINPSFLMSRCLHQFIWSFYSDTGRVLYRDQSSIHSDKRYLLYIMKIKCNLKVKLYLFSGQCLIGASCHMQFFQNLLKAMFVDLITFYMYTVTEIVFQNCFLLFKCSIKAYNRLFNYGFHWDLYTPYSVTTFPRHSV